MQVDNVSSPGVPGFAELGISPHSVENMLEQTSRSRQGGLPDGSAARTSWKQSSSSLWRDGHCVYPPSIRPNLVFGSDSAVAWTMRRRSVIHPRSSNRACQFPAPEKYNSIARWPC